MKRGFQESTAFIHFCHQIIKIKSDCLINDDSSLLKTNCLSVLFSFISFLFVKTRKLWYRIILYWIILIVENKRYYFLYYYLYHKK